VIGGVFTGGYEQDSLHSLDLKDSGELKGVICKLPLHLPPTVQNNGQGSSCRRLWPTAAPTTGRRGPQLDGEKEEEGKGIAWRCSPRTRADGEMAAGGRLGPRARPHGRGGTPALLTVYFGAPSMFITLCFGFDYGTNPPLGTLII
jgi:hypothetical protein